MGHAVTIVEPELDADGFPKGPDPRAAVCVEGLPQRQCFTAPQGFWRNPEVTVVQLEKTLPALLFSAETWGVSGFQIHFALLRPGTENDLEDLFLSDTSVSDQGQRALWNDPAISQAAIFVTADFVWGSDECHTCAHRYIISAYVRKRSSLVDGLFYYLEDRYMTARQYDLRTGTDILASEKQEILERLRRVKTETEHQRGGRR